jgi:putative peptide zinc metalloprotease protein
VTHLPKSEAKEIPEALSNKGGGPLAIRPTSPPKHFQPQNQVYLIGIDILDPDPAVSPGTLGQVKIHCEYRTCAWAVWRWISSALDLGLL